MQALSNKKYYIIKIIDISKMDRKQREEALNEVHVLKAMRHPYIITYRESFMEKKLNTTLKVDAFALSWIMLMEEISTPR